MTIDDIIETIIASSAEVISLDELKNLISLKKNFVIKIGFDPTTSDLHLGHLVSILKLRKLQEYGFKVIIIIGDFTAMIGDPSGKNSSRPALSREHIILNYKSYHSQIFKFLLPDFTNIYFNSSWYDFFVFDNFIRLVSFSTVSRMLERNDFKNRFESNIPIFINEFVYPLLQAYDSVFLDVDLEIGGIDQKFNFLISREIQKKFFQKSQVCLMMPLLLGIDGKNKMSKSLGNCINLNDDPYDIFCKVMSIPDFLIKDYLIYLGILDIKIYDTFILSFDNPMNLKSFLAYRVVALVYDESSAELSKIKFFNIFSKREFPGEIDITYLFFDRELVYLFDVLVSLSLVSSRSDFKRYLFSNSIEVNGKVIVDKCYVISFGLVYFLKFGKKKFFKIFLKKK